MSKKKSLFHIVLYAPEIPGNTGSIGRTCVALGIPLILIGPYGFEINEKSVRRAGLDYWKYLELREYQNWEHFLELEKPDNVFFFENHQKQNFYEAPYSKNCYLVFGSETKGLPPFLYERFKDEMYALPMFSGRVRSLNLSNVATTVAYECLRHLNFIR